MAKKPTKKTTKKATKTSAKKKSPPKKSSKKPKVKSWMGRPRAFNSPKELQEKLDRYFNSITITKPVTQPKIVGSQKKKVRSELGIMQEQDVPIFEEVPVLDNNGDAIMRTEFLEPPSLTDIQLFLGICRDTWNEYSHKPKYSDTIKKAKRICESYLEKALYRNSQVTGIIFNLKNNYDWRDKQDVDHNFKNIKVFTGGYRKLGHADA